MKVLVDYEKAVEYYEKYESELYGSQGFCYIKDGKISKIYFEPRILEYDFSKYSSDIISFPICYFYDKTANSFEMVVGELMDFFPGKSLAWSIDNDIEISVFLQQYQMIIKEIKRFSEIQMNDLCYPNILYEKNNGFYLIDSTNWVIDEKKSKDNKEKNINSLNTAIRETILNDYLEVMTLMYNPNFFKNLEKMGLNGKNLSKLLNLSLLIDRWSIVELLELYKEVFKNGDLGPIETLGDIKKYTKILKKG